MTAASPLALNGSVWRPRRMLLDRTTGGTTGHRNGPSPMSTPPPRGPIANSQPAYPGRIPSRPRRVALTGIMRLYEGVDRRRDAAGRCDTDGWFVGVGAVSLPGFREDGLGA